MRCVNSTCCWRAGKVEGCSLDRFEDATGLKLTDANGLKDELPPITTFLNRLLALTIELQNILFTAFEQLLTARIEGAIASGIYDVGWKRSAPRALSSLTGGRSMLIRRPAPRPGFSRSPSASAIIRCTLDEALDRLSDRAPSC